MNPAITLLLGRALGSPLNDDAWREVLAVADHALATPMLRAHPGLPPWVRGDVEARIAKVAQRRERLLQTYRDAAKAMQAAGIEFVLWKGFTHEADGSDPVLRVQSDIDFVLPSGALPAARTALMQEGFQIHPGRELSDNHGRPLLKPHAWQWQGDYFDPLQPVPVELHHTIWNYGWDRIPTPGVAQFWERRERIAAAGMEVPSFCDVDRLGAAALHLLRHVLRNNVRPAHASEVAQMLQRRSQDASFWEKWRTLHPPALRSLEAIAFQFACLWFGAAMPQVPREDWAALPKSVHAWFERFAFSPLENLTQPNKDVVWLHLGLLPKFRDRWSVAWRRLLPMSVPRAEEITQRSYIAHLTRRARYHGLALAGAARSKASQTSD